MIQEPPRFVLGGRRRCVEAIHFVQYSEPRFDVGDMLRSQPRVGEVSRGDVTLLLTQKQWRILLGLAVRVHRFTTAPELVEVVYGDDPTGGPDVADDCVRVGLFTMERVFAALGLRLANKWGWGWQLEFRPQGWVKPLYERRPAEKRRRWFERQHAVAERAAQVAIATGAPSQ